MRLLFLRKENEERSFPVSCLVSRWNKLWKEKEIVLPSYYCFTCKSNFVYLL